MIWALLRAVAQEQGFQRPEAEALPLRRNEWRPCKQGKQQKRAGHVGSSDEGAPISATDSCTEWMERVRKDTWGHRSVCPWRGRTGKIRLGLETIELLWNCWRCVFRWILNAQSLFSVIVDLVDEKGPHTKPDELRGGCTISETYSNHRGWSEIKTF